MTIEVTQVDRSAIAEPLPDMRSASGAAVTPPPAADQAAPSPNAMAAAVQQIQSAINNGPNPSFQLDYLSGLSVVTVRSTTTGEVVFQLPDTRALELARLINDGASVASLGLLHTEA